MKKFSLLLFVILVVINVKGQICGCTDSRANNYNPEANYNDGSCIYNDTTVLPLYTDILNPILSGTSGAVFYNNFVWSHNDHTDKNLYLLDTINGNVVCQLLLENIVNQDIEDIDQDSDYFYLGDFGNNSTGNRTDLHILRIWKHNLFISSPIIDTIFFSYSNQTDFTEEACNNTDFDCEAFVVAEDSIYLFTKQWNSLKTSLYCLPKVPGFHVAQLFDSLDVNGLITGACYHSQRKEIVLCGYSKLLSPFLYLLYDYHQNHFFSGNKRKVYIDLPFHQIEAITHGNGYRYYLTNEYFSYSTVITPAKYHIFDLTYLLSSVNLSTDNLSVVQSPNSIKIYPNPAKRYLFLTHIDVNRQYKYEIWTCLGQCISEGILEGTCIALPIQKMSRGYYLLKLYHQVECTAIPFIFND